MHLQDPRCCWNVDERYDEEEGRESGCSRVSLNPSHASYDPPPFCLSSFLSRTQHLAVGMYVHWMVSLPTSSILSWIAQLKQKQKQSWIDSIVSIRTRVTLDPDQLNPCCLTHGHHAHSSHPRAHSLKNVHHQHHEDGIGMKSIDHDHDYDHDHDHEWEWAKESKERKTNPLHQDFVSSSLLSVTGVHVHVIVKVIWNVLDVSGPVKKLVVRMLWMRMPSMMIVTHDLVHSAAATIQVVQVWAWRRCVHSRDVIASNSVIMREVRN